MRLAGFWLKRISTTVLTVLGSVTLVFLLLRSIPGDPVVIMLGEYATGEDYARLASSLGLDQPIYTQYFIYLARTLGGDWGRSLSTFELVFPYVLRKFEATLVLTFTGVILASLIGVPLGALAALRKGTRLDSILRVFSIAVYSVPVFWLGLIFMLVFALFLGLLPSFGRNPILPALTLGVWSSGIICRVSRASVMDVLDEDYILTALAKGISPTRFLTNHVLRNALIPIITIITIQFGMLLGGAIVTETVFSYPGMGLLIVDGIFRRDYPVVQGGVLMASIFVCITNFLVDVLYPMMDPRITYEA